MISALHNMLSQKKEIPSYPVDQQTDDHDAIARMVYLIRNLPEDQQFSLVRLLLKDKVSNILIKMVIDMSDEQRTTLLKQLEEIASRNGLSDKRSHPRKDCLINVDVSVHGPSSSSYILDINQTGAYIETNEPFSVGQEIKLSFSAPDSGNPLSVVGKIVWTDKQGVGINFNRMSKRQQRAIRSFSDNVETVYEINS